MTKRDKIVVAICIGIGFILGLFARVVIEAIV